MTQSIKADRSAAISDELSSDIREETACPIGFVERVQIIEIVSADSERKAF